MRALAALVLGCCVAALAPVHAAEIQSPEPPPTVAPPANPCAAFAWPLTKERIMLSRAPGARVASGSAVDVGPPTGFQLLLSPVSNVAFAQVPGKTADGGYGGVITLRRPPADGDYLVTLSDEGWIDVIQDDGALQSVAYSSAKNCPGMRQSVKFHLSARAPLVLQISGAKASSINVAVTPANFLNY